MRSRFTFTDIRIPSFYWENNAHSVYQSLSPQRGRICTRLTSSYNRTCHAFRWDTIPRPVLSLVVCVMGA